MLRGLARGKAGGGGRRETRPMPDHARRRDLRLGMAATEGKRQTANAITSMVKDSLTLLHCRAPRHPPHHVGQLAVCGRAVVDGGTRAGRGQGRERAHWVEARGLAGALTVERCP